VTAPITPWYSQARGSSDGVSEAQKNSTATSVPPNPSRLRTTLPERVTIVTVAERPGRDPAGHRLSDVEKARLELTAGPVAHGGCCVAPHEGRGVLLRPALPCGPAVAGVPDETRRLPRD